MIDRQLPDRQSIEDALDDLLRIGGDGAGEFLLVRHAEAAAGGGNDPMLSCRGLEQAERLADRLAESWLDAVYSASERRTQQTARIVAGQGQSTVQVLEGLMDIECDPGAAGAEPTATQYAGAFTEVPRWDNLPGFESGRQFRRRAVQTVERVLTSNTGRRVLIMTHASVINAYLSVLLCVPADRFFTPEPTSVSIVRWRDGRYAVRCLNDSSHLSGYHSSFGGTRAFNRALTAVNNPLKAST
jgi:broad specificity phosphatase PhoE